MLTFETPAADATEQMKHRILRTRQETRRRTLVVSGVERVTPAMARITFTAPDLADFDSPGHDDHVKLFFPGATDGSETLKRDYTPRMFDAARRCLVIDFALHDSGPATNWARTATVGDSLEIGGPRGSTLVTDDFDWYLLIGDETALPAIGRRVEELRPGVPVKTIIAIDDRAEVQNFATKADWHALWVERRIEGENDADSLIRVLENLQLPEGDGFVWIGAEAEVARTLRRHMLEARCHRPAWIKAAGYWVRGRDGANESFKTES
jgi:NADPH-dependent ferric siderophore reductase